MLAECQRVGGADRGGGKDGHLRSSLLLVFETSVRTVRLIASVLEGEYGECVQKYFNM